MNIEAIPLVAAIVAGVVPCALLWIAIVRQRAETNEAHVNLMIRLRTMEVEHLNLVRGIECTEILAKEERVRLE